MEKFLGIFSKIGRNFSDNRSEFFHEYVGKFPRNFSQVDFPRNILSKTPIFLRKNPSYICYGNFTRN
jgi:hypothetical protein